MRSAPSACALGSGSAQASRLGAEAPSNSRALLRP
jgi:hypothetical protein